MKKSTLRDLLAFCAIGIIILSTIYAVISSCNKKPAKQLEPSQPLLVRYDSITIEPNSSNWFFEVDSPDRGKIRVELSNYTDHPKTFKILVKE